MTSLTWSGCALAYVGKGAGGAGASSKGGDFAHVPGDVVPSAAGETCVRLYSHERKAERAVQALACGVGGGHHAVDRLYARKAQKLEECGVQATSRATALRGGCKVDGKLGVPSEGDAFAQLMGVGEPDDASAFLGDEAGVLLADAHDALGGMPRARGTSSSKVTGVSTKGAYTARMPSASSAEARRMHSCELAGVRAAAKALEFAGALRAAHSCELIGAHPGKGAIAPADASSSRSLRRRTLALSGRIAQGRIAHGKGLLPEQSDRSPW